MARLELRNIVKAYGKARVIHGVDLEIDHGEFVVFVGPSGCGKSTLLRMIAGLEEITDGEMLLDGEIINDVPAARRGLAMVFQSYALYPHMSVRKNLSFGLENLRLDRAEIDRRVAEAARMLEIGPLLERKPKALSGGQRQRVAIGRAVVREPKIFLFDEPLSNLDAELRVRMRTEITGLHERLGNTMIYVTHDQVEAMTMADKIVVLQSGRVEQVGRPLDLYNAPANMFVAGFIGSPRMNFIPVRAVGLGGTGVTVRLPDGHDVTCPVSPAGIDLATAVTLGIRPEHLTVLAADDGDVTATVTAVEQLGVQSFLYCDLVGGGGVAVQVPGQTHVRRGDRVGLRLDAARTHLFRTEGGMALARLELAVTRAAAV